MISSRTASAAFIVAAFGLASAQTQSKCNPTLGQSCPPDHAFGGDWNYDFGSKSSIKDLKSDFNIDGGVEFGDPATLVFDKSGAKFLLSKPLQAPTINTTNYIFFGRVDVVMKAATGGGIVSSIVLQSDDQDEIDWEFIGNHDKEVQTNFYRKGDFNDNSHGKTYNVSIEPRDDFHTYTIDWTKDYIRWSLDGNVIRDAYQKDFGEKWPQTPCQLKIGAWAAGDSPMEGTSQWAGGKVNWGAGPFAAVYKSIKLTDYGGGNTGATEYTYDGTSGDWNKIIVKGGSAKAMPSSPDGSGSGSGSSGTTSSKPSVTISATSVSQSATGVIVPPNPTASSNSTSTVPKGTGSDKGPTQTTSAPTKSPSSAADRMAAPLAGLGLLGLLLL